MLHQLLNYQYFRNLDQIHARHNDIVKTIYIQYMKSMNEKVEDISS